MTKGIRRGLVVLVLVFALLAAGKPASAGSDRICMKLSLGSMGQPVVCVPLLI